MFTETCSILFDEEDLKSYKQQGKSMNDLEMYNTKVIKDELLAVGYMDGAIRLWDLKLGQYCSKVYCIQGNIAPALFSPLSLSLSAGECKNWANFNVSNYLS